MQGPGGPRIYNHLTLPIRDGAKTANDGIEIVRVESFQLYNAVKQQIRRNVQQFYPGHSILSSITRLREDGRGVWEYVVDDVIWAMFEVVSESVEEMCVEMIDIYSPVVVTLSTGDAE